MPSEELRHHPYPTFTTSPYLSRSAHPILRTATTRHLSPCKRPILSSHIGSRLISNRSIEAIPPSKPSCPVRITLRYTTMSRMQDRRAKENGSSRKRKGRCLSFSGAYLNELSSKVFTLVRHGGPLIMADAAAIRHQNMPSLCSIARPSRMSRYHWYAER